MFERPAPMAADPYVVNANVRCTEAAYAPGDGRLVSDGEIQSLAVLDHR